MDMEYDFVVVGAGVFGISTCLFLAINYPNKRVALLQQFKVGHLEGSSHSQSRIIRSTYRHEFYRDLCLEGIKNFWPQVEKTLGDKFIQPNPCISYIQSNDSFKEFQQVAKTSNGQLQMHSVQTIRKMFPTSPYIETDKPVFLDTKAGVVLAQKYLIAAINYLRTCPNMTIHQQTKLTSLVNNKQSVQIKVTKKDDNKFSIRCSKISLSCGRWIASLVPQLQKICRPVKQVVSYWQMSKPQEYAIGRFPCWIHYDKNGHDRYGLPDLTGIGIKYAFYTKDQVGDKKYRTQEIAKKIIIKGYQQQVQRYFRNQAVKLSKIETCYFTMTNSEDFLIDWRDQHQNVLIVSPCSGHGFKFGAVIGKVVADLLNKNSSIDVFQKHRYLCRLYYHLGVNLQ